MTSLPIKKLFSDDKQVIFFTWPYVLGDFNSGVLDGGNAIPDEYLTAVVEVRIGKTSSS